jgi:long-chain acyl-CoA synthetase
MAVDPSTLALQRIYKWEQSIPNEIYLTQPIGKGAVKDYTWAQTMNEVRRMATHLQSFGWPAGTRIALLSKNTAHWIMTDFAIWMAGFVSVPLYPTLAPDTIRRILDHSESKLLFVGKLDGWDGMKSGIPADLPCIAHPLAPANNYPKWDDIVAKSAPMKDSPLRPADDMNTIIYTSGTTGMPKGVMHSFGTFASALNAGMTRAAIVDGARMLSYLPLAHVAERILVEHGSLAVRMHLFFADSLDTFTADLQRARPTFFFSVPRLWVKFQQGVNAKMPAEKLDRMLKIPILRGIVKKKILTGLGLDQCVQASGGASPMPLQLMRFWEKLGLPITEGYGMTENCAVSHSTEVGKPRPGTVGPAFTGVQCRIAPDTGEIQVLSGGQMLGYYKEPELTRQALTEDGWLRTGDKGTIDAEGNLKITGRVKDLFKTSKGKYVAPAPIEDRLVTHPAIEACLVTGANLPQPLGIAMISLEAAKAAKADNRAALTASLAAHLKMINDKLDPHEQLDCLVATETPWTVENDLVTPTLKVKRNRVDDTFGKNYEKWTGMRKPIIWS